MASVSSEITWTIRLLEELGITHIKFVTLQCDNQSALHIARNPVFHDRTKHIEVDCHFTRDKVLQDLIQLTNLPTQHQLGDVLTETLPSQQLKLLLSKLGMVSYSKLEGGDKILVFSLYVVLATLYLSISCQF